MEQAPWVGLPLIQHQPHTAMMATGITTMVNTKTTRMMLYKLLVLSLDTEPFYFFANLNKKNLPFFFRCVSLCIPNVLDFFTEVIIISG
jgi:hypothetical protein